MRLNNLIRQCHRWLSVIFTAVAAALFIALGIGSEPAPWVYFLPLPPLGLMTVTGLYMFFQPYVARRRAGRGMAG